MNLRLSEEERLIKETVSRFVKAEVLPLELQFLKQKEPFPPPGDPPARDLAPELRNVLVEKAKASGIGPSIYRMNQEKHILARLAG